MKKKQKSAVSAKELEKKLADFIVKTGLKNIKKIDFSSSEENYLWREMIIVNVFAVIQVIRQILNNEHLENEILENLHRDYYQGLVEQFDFTEEQIVGQFNHALSRYQDYQEIIDDESSSDWLEKVTERMYRNLQKFNEDEPVDPEELERFGEIFSLMLKEITGFLPDGKIISEWE
ncbi:MAG: hypothetical protein ABII74_05565 [Elusimicrobiota bacterium]